MGQEAITEPQGAETDQSQEAGKRERSSIQFPYLPLEEAFAIAKGVHTIGGTSCQVDQLAAHLNQKADTGSFRLKLGTSKQFGLTNHSLGTVTLTPLGSRICDPQTEVAAKVESFLTIPLYKMVYEQFKGTNLPPLSGLETAMVNMGVAPKQKATARQVFHRSATFAGFFSYGAGRLVPPSTKAGTGATAAPPQEPAQSMPFDAAPEKPAGRNGGGDGGGGRHQLIMGLVDTLPVEKTDWPLEDRKEWLEGAAAIFNLIYKNPTKGAISIEVKEK